MDGKPSSTDEYLAALAGDKRAALQELRDVIHAAAPGAGEDFSYGMPMFRLDGKPLIWYAAWERHYGLYPIGAAMLQAYAADVEGYETSKGTIRFPASRPLPLDLVRKLVQARIAGLCENAK